MTIEQFVENFFPEPNSGCWIWMGAITNGYGNTTINGVFHYTHRLSYEIVRGKIPNGLVIDHLCRVRACGNPAHMEVVTHRINILRGNGMSAKHVIKTHCPRGHEFAGNNLIVTRKGSRACRSCRTISQQNKMKRFYGDRIPNPIHQANGRKSAIIRAGRRA